jgi:PAS domain S-box-containing protein
VEQTIRAGRIADRRPPRGPDQLIGVTLEDVFEFVALINVSGEVVGVNRGAEAMAGLGRSSLIGRPIWLCPPFDVEAQTGERLRALYERAVRGEPARDVVERELGDSKHLMELSVKALRGGGADTELFVVEGRDLSALKQAEQKVDELRRERDALLRRCRELEPLGDVKTSTSAPTLAGGRPRILVVEDSPEMNRFLTVALSRNYEVDSAYDGAAGLARALECPPDLVLTDVMMPKLNGDALVRELRGHREMDDIPIVLLTAKTEDELRVRLLREGAQDFLAKPFSAKELLVRVSNLVDMKRARQVLREEVATQGRDLESLARALALRTRELAGALDSTRLARENAERAGEAKNMFLSVASHELRTPIAALQLRVDRLRRNLGPNPSPEAEETLRGVQRAIARLTALVESLLQYSKVQSNQMPLAPATFDAAGALGDIVDETRGTAEQKGLVLGYLRPDAPVTIETDPSLFRLVVANLIDNALKFTDRGQIDVILEAGPNLIRVRVRDTGPGVAPGDRARIFEPFQHVEPADKKHTPGVGLGLALVREVMGVLGGSVELDSTLGTGSTFSVLLPVVRSRPPAVEPAEG